MATASLQFLAYSFVVIIVFNLFRSAACRQFVLLVASIGFLLCFSQHPVEFLPLVAFLAFGFVSLRVIQAGRTGAFLSLLIVAIGAFVWLKKYAFMPSVLFLQHPYLMLGFSYIFFRILHLIIDARYGDLPRNVSLVSYLNYTLNFTTLVSGPIQRYQDFAEMQLARVPLPLNLIVAGQSLERIVVGFFKVNVLSLILSMIQAQALDTIGAHRATSQQVLTGVLIAAAYPLYLYCNFSGYIDIVIGVARFLRIALPENFNRPFSSDNFIDFWSRWHITLSMWLKTYVYNPLLILCMRRWPSRAAEPFLGVFAYFVTFFLVGLWHGQTSAFIFFGVLQGLGVSLTKLHQVLMAKWIGHKQYRQMSRQRLYNVATRGLTFTWFTFSLLWFWSNWMQLGTLARSFRASEMAFVWIAIFLGSSVILALWEAILDRLLSLQIAGEPLLMSRYVRTSFTTALAVIALATLMLLNAPEPAIVYKAF